MNHLKHRVERLEGHSERRGTVFLWHEASLSPDRRDNLIRAYCSEHGVKSSDVFPIPYSGEDPVPEPKIMPANTIDELFEYVAEHGKRLGPTRDA